MCHAYCFGQIPGPKFPRFQLALNKIFCPTAPALAHQQFKHGQRTKIIKTNTFCLPLIGFPLKVPSISIEKQVSNPS